MEKDTSSHEELPSMKIEFGDGRIFEATPENSTIFTFAGRLAMYDHVFFTTNEEENYGTYLFSVHEGYQEITTFMVENEYPWHGNLREVAECDIDAYDKMLHRDAERDLEGGVPADWS